MALLRAVPLSWFDNQLPPNQFAAYSLVLEEIGEGVENLSPEILKIRSSETVKSWLMDLDARHQNLNRQESLENLRAIAARIAADWGNDFKDHGFISNPRESVGADSSDATTPELPASRLVSASRKLLKSQMLTEAAGILVASYLLTEEGKLEQVTTSQVTAIMKKEGMFPSNASATVQSLAVKKDPDLEILGKTNRGRRQEWLFRLTPEALRRTRERLLINADEDFP